MRLLCFGGMQVALCLFAASAHADAPLDAEFRTSASHAELARRACAMSLATRVADTTRPIEVHALEDGVAMCSTETSYPDAIVVVMRMVSRGDPFVVTLAIDVPASSSPSPADYAALRVAKEAIESASLDALPTTPPRPSGDDAVELPVRRTTSRMDKLVIAGAWMMALASIPTTIVGFAIATGSSSYPGTSQVWPFVPFVGMTVFSATYTEVSGCNCPSARTTSLLLSTLIDGGQIAGLVMVLVGSTSSKKSRVGRLFPTPLGIGGTF